MTLGDLLRRLWRDDGGEKVDAQSETAVTPVPMPADDHRREVARVTAQLDDMEREVAVLAAQARLVRTTTQGRATHGH